MTTIIEVELVGIMLLLVMIIFQLQRIIIRMPFNPKKKI